MEGGPARSEAPLSFAGSQTLGVLWRQLVLLNSGSDIYIWVFATALLEVSLQVLGLGEVEELHELRDAPREHAVGELAPRQEGAHGLVRLPVPCLALRIAVPHSQAPRTDLQARSPVVARSTTPITLARSFIVPRAVSFYVGL